VKNPFVYGKTVSGEHFCNRDKEVKELVAEVITCQNIIILSPRRYGKASLNYARSQEGKIHGDSHFLY